MPTTTTTSPAGVTEWIVEYEADNGSADCDPGTFATRDAAEAAIRDAFANDVFPWAVRARAVPFNAGGHIVDGVEIVWILAEEA